MNRIDMHIIIRMIIIQRIPSVSINNFTFTYFRAKCIEELKSMTIFKGFVINPLGIDKIGLIYITDRIDIHIIMSIITVQRIPSLNTSAFLSIAGMIK
jgi:hypothetical protein